MPPRRKKATQKEDTEDVASTSATRATRKSTRQKDSGASSVAEKSTTTTTRKRKATVDGQEDKKIAKRTRGSKATDAPVLKTDDDNGEPSNAGGKADAPSAQIMPSAEVVRRPDELFDAYADPKELDTMGADGLERLCTDAKIPMDGTLPLLLAWQLDAKELATFSKDEWTKGLNVLEVKSLQSLSAVLTDLEALLILRKPPPSRSPTQSISKGIKSKSAALVIDKYNKKRYWGYVSNVEAAFSNFYSFLFGLVKKEGSRNIDMDYALAFWSVVLEPIYPIMSEIIEFINERGTYKGVNKDLWNMMKDFCRIVKPSLEGYDSDGAWPTLLDDFVAWKNAKGEASRESIAV